MIAEELEPLIAAAAVARTGQRGNRRERMLEQRWILEVVADALFDSGGARRRASSLWVGGFNSGSRSRLPVGDGWLGRFAEAEFVLGCGSSHDREQPAPADRPWPAPYLPGVLAFGDREEDDLGPTDNVLERHIADLAEHAAVGRVVAVVAHHEVMTGGHMIDRGIVVEAVIDQIERRIAHAVRQRFAPALHAFGAGAFLGLDEILDALALDRLRR